MKTNQKRKGFTLVELLVVIAILAILASVTVVGYLGFTKTARESAVMQEAEQAQNYLIAEFTDGEAEVKIDTGSATISFTYDQNTKALTATTTVPNLTAANVAEALATMTGLKADSFKAEAKDKTFDEKSEEILSITYTSNKEVPALTIFSDAEGFNIDLSK